MQHARRIILKEREIKKKDREKESYTGNFVFNASCFYAVIIFRRQLKIQFLDKRLTLAQQGTLGTIKAPESR